MDTQQQRQYKILLIGDSCIDEYMFGRCDRLSPEAPVPILKVSRHESRPGMSANVRQNLEGLGCDVVHITNASQIKKIRVIDETFNQHIVRIDDHDHVDPISLDALMNDGFLMQFDAFIFSDYNKGFLSDSSISQIIKMIKQARQDNIILVDSKKKNLLSYGDAIIKINKREFATLAKYSKDAEFVITLGSDGARYLDRTYPAFKTEVYDVCGAGDTFLAGLAFQYLRGNGDMSSAIMFANLCSAFTIKKIGAYAVQLDEVSIAWKDYCKSLSNKT